MAINHNPKHRYDCGNCKFNWCCGYTCACALKEVPEEPQWLKKQLQSIQKIIDNETKLRNENLVLRDREAVRVEIQERI
jgi:hypothetical protein